MRVSHLDQQQCEVTNTDPQKTNSDIITGGTSSQLFWGWAVLSRMQLHTKTQLTLLCGG